jgi:hypothetical protein
MIVLRIASAFLPDPGFDYPRLLLLGAFATANAPLSAEQDPYALPRHDRFNAPARGQGTIGLVSLDLFKQVFFCNEQV